MSGVRCIAVIFCLLLLSINDTIAKVHWLPDFLGDNADRNSDAPNDSSITIDDQRTCPNGWYSETEIEGMDCVLKGSFPWIGYCYGDCICKEDFYPYTFDNCTGTYAPSGKFCDDGTLHYVDCHNLCDDVTHQSCNYGCSANYAVCPSKCETCYPDNCHNRTSKICEYGCLSYYSDCSTACETCYADNCRNRTSKSCDYGCASYYEDCPSKCETCNTCAPNDCSAYTLSSCPDNGVCESCEIGCGDSAERQKLVSCKSGYTKDGDTCKPECDFTDYPLTSCPIGGNCSYYTCNGTKKFKLNSCKSGYIQNNNSCCKQNSCSGYDLTSCPSGELCEICVKGCGDGEYRYKIATSALIIDVEPNSSGYINFLSSMSGSFTLYCSNREYPQYGSPGSCANKSDDIVTVSITGNLTMGKFINVVKIRRMDLSALKKITFSCTSDNPNLSGTIPEFPPNLQSLFFSGCGLTGSIPAFPSSLTAFNFYDCTGLTGSIPEIPSGVTSTDSSFYGCSSLTGPIPDLPDSITDASDMFKGCSSIRGSIPQLPSSLKDGYAMFSGCSSLTGNIPEIPDSITNMSAMFKGCSNLTGNIPEIPNHITSISNTFDGCSGLTGTIPSYPHH